MKCFRHSLALVIMSWSVSGHGAVSLGICGKLLSKAQPQALMQTVTPTTLDRISGRVSLHQGPRGYSATFKSTSGESSEIDGGAGEQLIEALKSHIDENSPTALRVEEKAIIETSDVQRFLKETQESVALAAHNKNQSVVWSQRDKPRDGHQFVTLTEYGGQIIYHLDNSAVSFVAKARYRKYYEFPVSASQDLNQYQPVLNDLTAFEIKMTSLMGPKTDGFLAEPETVFKPRIMITNEIADGLKLVRGNDLNMIEKLNELKEKVLALNKSGATPLNRVDQVEDLFSGLVILLKTDSNFLQPSLAISYERESYRFISTKGEFQFTVDKNVKMFRGNSNTPTAQMKQYLMQPMTFQSRPNEAFAEIKTPIKEKQSQDPLYVGLYDAMNLNHLPGYRKGSGKKSVAKFLEQAIGDQNVDKTLFELGTKFWISKSVSSLDTYPKKNNLITKQEIEMAVPFTAKNGEEFKLVISYQPVKKQNSAHIAVLSELRIYDPNGMKVSLQPNFDNFVREVVMKKDLKVIGLDIDDMVIPFPIRLTADEVKHYEDFLSTFFKEDSTLTGSVRSLDKFSEVNSQSGLKYEMAKLKAANFVKWVIDRTGKVAFSALLTTGLITYFAFGNNPAAAPVLPVSAPTQIEQVLPADVQPVISVNGFKDQAGQSVPLMGYLDKQNNYYFYFDAKLEQKYKQQKSIQLFGKSGDSVQLTAVGVKNGRTIYSMSK
jgi:hypothetical protein